MPMFLSPYDFSIGNGKSNNQNLCAGLSKMVHLHLSRRQIPTSIARRNGNYIARSYKKVRLNIYGLDISAKPSRDKIDIRFSVENSCHT